jgi:hypothetical protein
MACRVARADQATSAVYSEFFEIPVPWLSAKRAVKRGPVRRANKQQPRDYSVFLKPLAAETHREICTARGSFRSRECVWIGTRMGLNVRDNVRCCGCCWASRGHGLLQCKWAVMTRSGHRSLLFENLAGFQHNRRRHFQAKRLGGF